MACFRGGVSYLSFGHDDQKSVLCRLEICGTFIDNSGLRVYDTRIERCGTDKKEVSYGKTGIYVNLCR